MNRERPRFRFGEITGEEIAVDAGAEAVVPLGITDYYEPLSRTVFLSKATAKQRGIHEILRAVHEAMHARQHAEMSVTWRLYCAGRWAWVPWCACAGLAVWRFREGDWLRGVALVLLTLFCGVLRGFTILNLETDAWARTRKWVMDNFITGPDDWAAMDRITKASVGSYLRGVFGI